MEWFAKTRLPSVSKNHHIHSICAFNTLMLYIYTIQCFLKKMFKTDGRRVLANHSIRFVPCHINYIFTVNTPILYLFCNKISTKIISTYFIWCVPTLPEHEFTRGFKWGSCYSIFSFMCIFCRSLFVLLSFFNI
jgi:hypothetical protein